MDIDPQADTPFGLSPVLSAGTSVAGRAFGILLSQIMTFRLKPFELVSEKAISEALGISRTPVREALARLAGLGLIDIYPQRGSVVAPLRLADLEKSQFLREALEVGLVGRAVASPNRPHLLHKLKDELVLQEALSLISDDRRFFKSDELFHQHIANHAGFPGLWAEISAAKLHMDRFRFLTFPRVDSMKTVIDQHRAIVDSIEIGEARRAEEAMREHLRRIFSVIGIVQQRHPEYFSDEDQQPQLARPRRGRGEKDAVA
ncbi:GntR family transcriptional regulator [Labrys monachus]|uniref:DNA-binding GntR family transcriptional regulator n=1 Tax=Labrys monachus TaxID=217067 RepID=A0ABU0FBT6_9HYPH|nr:GntR family transcriptional regulator [Labrys monachus]MDQ0392075.1 DNA-binding GntR family transcriptional regulator [Labrys monachus]